MPDPTIKSDPFEFSRLPYMYCDRGWLKGEQQEIADVMSAGGLSPDPTVESDPCEYCRIPCRYCDRAG